MSVPVYDAGPSGRRWLALDGTADLPRGGGTFAGVLGPDFDRTGSLPGALRCLLAEDYGVVLVLSDHPTQALELVFVLRQRWPVQPLILCASVPGALAPLAATAPLLGIALLDAAPDPASVRTAVASLDAPGGGALPDGRPAAKGRLERGHGELLDAALAGLFLVYQPVFRLRSRALIGHEVLLRSTLPGLRTPQRLIGLAARLGRTADVDDRVRAVLAQALDQHRIEGSILLNLDASELKRGLLGSEADPLAARAPQIIVGFGGQDLPLDDETTHDTVDRIHQAGYRVAIGGLYDPLDELVRQRVLRPDIYKIGPPALHPDRVEGAGRQGIVDLVQLARYGGAEVAALGIEDEAGRQLMGDLGCSLLQGHLVGRPKPQPVGS